MQQSTEMKLAPYLQIPQAEYSFAWDDGPMDGILVTSFTESSAPQLLQRGFILDSSPFFGTVISQLEAIFLKPFVDLYQQAGSSLVNSIINHFVIRIDKQGAHVKVNMLENTTTRFFVRNAPTVGERANMDDFTSAYQVILDGEEFAAETGVMILLSVGWHRLLYLDFKPVSDPAASLDDLPRQLAIAANALYFPQPTPEMLERLFQHNWFPFTFFPLGQWMHFLGRLQSGTEWPEIRDDIIASMTPANMGQMVAEWNRNKRFKKHIDFVKGALRSYLDGDYPASIHLVWPQIEGLMGALSGSRKQNAIISHMEQEVLYPLKHMGGFMPQVFREYLEKRYFRDFNVETNDVEISRHSLAHAALRYEDMTQENALLGFLILDQLHQLLWALDVDRPKSDLEFTHV